MCVAFHWCVWLARAYSLRRTMTLSLSVAKIASISMANGGTSCLVALSKLGFVLVGLYRSTVCFHIACEVYLCRCPVESRKHCFLCSHQMPRALTLSSHFSTVISEPWRKRSCIYCSISSWVLYSVLVFLTNSSSLYQSPSTSSRSFHKWFERCINLGV